MVWAVLSQALLPRGLIDSLAGASAARCVAGDFAAGASAAGASAAGRCIEVAPGLRRHFAREQLLSLSKDWWVLLAAAAQVPAPIAESPDATGAIAAAALDMGEEGDGRGARDGGQGEGEEEGEGEGGEAAVDAETAAVLRWGVAALKTLLAHERAVSDRSRSQPHLMLEGTQTSASASVSVTDKCFVLPSIGSSVSLPEGSTGVVVAFNRATRLHTVIRDYSLSPSRKESRCCMYCSTRLFATSLESRLGFESTPTLAFP
jgi:hypothetical protein